MSYFYSLQIAILEGRGEILKTVSWVYGSFWHSYSGMKCFFNLQYFNLWAALVMLVHHPEKLRSVKHCNDPFLSTTFKLQINSQIQNSEWIPKVDIHGFCVRLSVSLWYCNTQRRSASHCFIQVESVRLHTGVRGLHCERMFADMAVI